LNPTVIRFNPSDPNLRAIRDAALAALQGKIVSFPTETVYGIGAPISNVEGMIMHAYCSGIRHVAVIANSKSYKPIEGYLKKRLGYLKDLKVVVTVQPLLPMIKAFNDSEEFIISEKNGGYPGGHGHGFKYCLRNRDIQNVIKEEELEFFIFSNGDNAVVLNWGANHFITATYKKIGWLGEEG